MDQVARRVVFASEQIERVEALMQQFPKDAFEVSRMVRADGAATLLESVAFDLVVIVPPLSRALELVKRMRSPESPSRNAALIVVADAEADISGRPWWADGSYTVIGPTEARRSLPERAARMMNAASRTATRLPVRLRCEDTVARERALCQTVNISVSGMLISGCRRLPEGSEIEFEVTLPTRSRPVSGRARVVRHTNSRHEAKPGTAVEFIRLNEADRTALNSFVVGQAPGQPAPVDGELATPAKPAPAPTRAMPNATHATGSRSLWATVRRIGQRPVREP